MVLKDLLFVFDKLTAFSGKFWVEMKKHGVDMNKETFTTKIEKPPAKVNQANQPNPAVKPNGLFGNCVIS